MMEYTTVNLSIHIDNIANELNIRAEQGWRLVAVVNPQGHMGPPVAIMEREKA